MLLLLLLRNNANGQRLHMNDSLQRMPLRLLANDCYINNLPFFCRKEYELEKATKLPLRFRLGSLAYTDYLEQKPTTIKKP